MTPNDTPISNDPAPERPWFQDPLALDRYLDGEAGPAEDRDSPRGGTPLVEARRAYLGALREAGARYRADLRNRMPGDLEMRVRARLADRPPSARYRWLVAAAAVALLSLGAALWSRGGDEVEAMPPQILTAAELARMSEEAQALAPGGCNDASLSGPMHFPPIEEGGLQIVRCSHDGTEMKAHLSRPEDLPLVGYVAVPDSGVQTGPTIGMTDLGDLVVFDLAYGKQHHYLAVGRAFLDRERERAPGRESCRACHNRSREGQDNPHRIVARSWR